MRTLCKNRHRNSEFRCGLANRRQNGIVHLISCLGNTPKGPTKKIDTSVEMQIKNNSHGLLYVQRALTCGDYIESQYYNPTTGLKGGRILTPDICAIC